jgi:hypothetical protein
MALMIFLLHKHTTKLLKGKMLNTLFNILLSGSNIDGFETLKRRYNVSLMEKPKSLHVKMKKGFNVV